MGKNSKYMTKINRLPPGAVLKRERCGKHGSLRWVGKIKIPNVGVIGPIRNPNLGTVVENLLILIRRREQDEKGTN